MDVKRRVCAVSSSARDDVVPVLLCVRSMSMCPIVLICGEETDCFSFQQIVCFACSSVDRTPTTCVVLCQCASLVTCSIVCVDIVCCGLFLWCVLRAGHFNRAPITDAHANYFLDVCALGKSTVAVSYESI